MRTQAHGNRHLNELKLKNTPSKKASHTLYVRWVRGLCRAQQKTQTPLVECHIFREFRFANIRSLAAYERARRALRGECEPMRLRRRVRFLVPATSTEKEKAGLLSCFSVLVTGTGIEPMFSA